MALMNCPECGKEVSDNAVNCVHCGCPLHQTNIPFAQKVSPAQAKKNKKTGKILAIIFGVLVVFMIIGILGSGDSDNANTPSTAGTTQTAAPPEEIEYIEITATELIEAYDENGVSADNKYKNQMLKITGMVSNIDKDILDSAYIALANDNNQYSFVSVQCYFDKNNLNDIAELVSGDIVTVTGKCDGSTFNVIIKKCNIEK